MDPREILIRFHDHFVNPDGTLRRPAHPTGGAAMSPEEMEARGLWDQLATAKPSPFGDDGRPVIQKLLNLLDDIYEVIPAAGNLPEAEREFLDEFEDAVSGLQTILQIRELEANAKRMNFVEVADEVRAAVSMISSRLLNDEPVQPHEWKDYTTFVAALNERLEAAGLPPMSTISGELMGEGNEALYVFGVATSAIPIEEAPDQFRADVFRAVDKAVALFTGKKGQTEIEAQEQPTSSWSPEGTEENLLLSINPGTASREEIAELLADLSRIYRKAGGSGIIFRFEDVTIKEEELA